MDNPMEKEHFLKSVPIDAQKKIYLNNLYDTIADSHYSLISKIQTKGKEGWARIHNPTTPSSTSSWKFWSKWIPESKRKVWITINKDGWLTCYLNQVLSSSIYIYSYQSTYIYLSHLYIYISISISLICRRRKKCYSQYPFVPSTK